MGRIFLTGLVFIFAIIGCAHQPERNSSNTRSPDGQPYPTQLSNGYVKTTNPQTGKTANGIANPGKGLKNQIKATREHPLSGSQGDACPDPVGPPGTLSQALQLCNESKIFREKGDIGQALAVLDQAYARILEIDEADGGAAVQQKEELRFTISKRILEIYASKTTSLPGDRKAIPIDLNPRVMDEVRSFTDGAERDFFESAYARSGKYRSFIVAALEEAGMPQELSWLPLIESGFKTSALSPARALGLWQFIPSTGYRYGLTRNKYIDERLDFEKSTHAAIAYLKDLHELFGDWETVLAAYNCGEGKILRTIRDQNINYLDNFWDLYDQLPLETARYVPRFIAILHIISNLEKYGLETIAPEPTITYETADVSQSLLHLRDIAATVGVSESILKELNPELRYNTLPEGPYALRVPAGFKENLLANIGNIPVHPPAASMYASNSVMDDETPITSSDTPVQKTPKPTVKGSTSGKASKTEKVTADRKSKIPLQENNDKIQPPSTTASKLKNRSDDTRISQKEPARPSPIRADLKTPKKQKNQANAETSVEKSSKKSVACSKSKEKKPNGTLTATVPPPSKKAPRPYKVRQGDSPIAIANSHRMSLDRLLEINQLKHTARLTPGQTLFVE